MPSRSNRRPTSDPRPPQARMLQSTTTGALPIINALLRRTGLEGFLEATLPREDRRVPPRSGYPPGAACLDPDLVAERHARSHRVGWLQDRTDVGLTLAHKASQQGPDIEDHGRPASFVAEGFCEPALAAAGRKHEQDAAGSIADGAFTLAAPGTSTERLQVVEATALLERFSAVVDRDEAGLLELAGFDLPQGSASSVPRLTSDSEKGFSAAPGVRPLAASISRGSSSPAGSAPSYVAPSRAISSSCA